MYTTFLITYSDLLIYVWARIIASANTDEILSVLNQEISDGLCMCFTDKLTRLLNTLVRFYDDIELQITNIIMGLKNKFADEKLKDVVKKNYLKDNIVAKLEYKKIDLLNICNKSNYYMPELYINDNNINDLDNCDYLNIKELRIFVPNDILNLLLDKLYKFTNLQILDLSINRITEIKGLDNLINLQILYLHNNKITEIKAINNLVNLQGLYLGFNQITEIKRLNNLINLKELYLNSNQITEIKGLDSLINLKELYLNSNQITEIKGLDNLINLKKIYLHNNKIIELKGFDNLINLRILYLHNNKITELPLNLCNLRNIINFNITNNPIEYIPLPVQRWLDRINNRITSNNMIYNDKQNIHNHYIQNSFRNSLNNILKDKQLLDLAIIKQQILENSILTEQTKREILNYCDDDTMHFSFLITYSDLLIYVWSRIIASPNADEILSVLNQEISDGLCMCFTGRLTRLLNTLVGFYSDIELQISDSEQITNIIMGLKKNFASGEELRNAVRKELLERQYSDSIINEWICYI